MAYMPNVTSSAVGRVDRDEAHVDAAVMAIAARQHAAITTAQLRAVGVGRGAIAHRVKTGRLRPLHRGVYLVGPLAQPYTAEMAALLACGVERSALSFLSAAAIHGWRPKPPIVEVSVRQQVRPRGGIRIHRTTSLEVTIRHGLRVTTPTRTLEDLATILTLEELERTIQEAHAQGLTLLPSRRSPALSKALKAEPGLTRSEAERRLLDLIRNAGLARPRTNTRLAGYEVDFLWPAQRLVVEVDGFAFHSSRRAFERDRLRDATLTAAGIRVIRVTWRQLVREPEAVIARLAAALALAA